MKEQARVMTVLELPKNAQEQENNNEKGKKKLGISERIKIQKSNIAVLKDLKDIPKFKQTESSQLPVVSTHETQSTRIAVNPPKAPQEGPQTTPITQGREFDSGTQWAQELQCGFGIPEISGKPGGPNYLIPQYGQVAHNLGNVKQSQEQHRFQRTYNAHHPRCEVYKSQTRRKRISRNPYSRPQEEQVAHTYPHTQLQDGCSYLSYEEEEVPSALLGPQPSQEHQ